MRRDDSDPIHFESCIHVGAAPSIKIDHCHDNGQRIGGIDVMQGWRTRRGHEFRVRFLSFLNFEGFHQF